MHRVGQKGEDGDRGLAGPPGLEGKNGLEGVLGPKGVLGQKGNPVSVCVSPPPPKHDIIAKNKYMGYNPYMVRVRGISSCGGITHDDLLFLRGHQGRKVIGAHLGRLVPEDY